MIYLIIALAIASAGAGFLGWRLYLALKALRDAEGRCRALQRERALRENLQTMLDSRNAEARRLRSRVRRLESDMADMEQQTSELNLNLFHESGLRILHEKEEGARRMKLDLMEKQLDELTEKLKQERQASREAREQVETLQALAAEQQQTIERLSAHPRRSAKNTREGLPNQITLEDLFPSE